MSERESSSFDPYHRWLGIAPKDQPPNHYRLLGVDMFESHPDVIESAADRQMRHLRAFQAGKNGKLSQKLLNELSMARICLLDPEKKAAYDAQLRAERARQTIPAVAVPVPTQLTAPEFQPAANQTPLPAQNLQPVRPHPSLQGTFSPSPYLATKPMPGPWNQTKKNVPVWMRPQVYLPVAVGTVLGLFALVTVILIFVLSSRPDADQLVQQTTHSKQTHLKENDPLTKSSPANVPEISEPRVNEPRVNEPPKTDVKTNSQSQRPDVHSQASEPTSKLTGIGADVEVARMQMVPFEDPQRLPDRPDIAYRFDWISKPKSADISNGMMQFDVKQDGWVYLVTDTQYQGNRSGGWWEERVTRQDLAKQGWEDLGACPWNDKETLLRRFVKTGESYRIRTNKYGPPKLIIPGPINGSGPAAGSPNSDVKQLLGQHILRLGEKGGVELANTKGLFSHDRQWTIEFWARLDPNAKALNLVGDRVMGGHRDLQEPDGGFMVRCTTSDGQKYVAEILLSSGGFRRFEIKPNDWQHFAVTSDTKHLRFFVNGQLVIERASDPNDWKPSPLGLHIGYHRFLFWSVAHGFHGDLRALRVSSNCNYRETFTPPTEFTKSDDTEILLSFLNPTNDQIEDLSGHGYHGTITGGEWIPLSE